MILIDRWGKILNYLKENQSATVHDLMDAFDISKSTVRRDLIAMEEQGLIKRTRGGAEIEVREDNIINIKDVFNKDTDKKRKIAKKAASLIKNNDFIFIDSGSTCYYLIENITANNVTVVTNGLFHIQKLFEKNIKTYILGGYATPDYNMIIGEDMADKVSMMNFDVAFIGTLGIHCVGGFTTNNLVDRELKKAVIKASQRCFVLADTSKFNVRKFYTYGDLKEASIITDSTVDFDAEDTDIIFA